MLAALVVAWTSVINEFSLINGDSCRMGGNQVEEVLMVLVSSSEDSFSLCLSEEPRNLQEHLDLKKFQELKLPNAAGFFPPSVFSSGNKSERYRLEFKNTFSSSRVLIYHPELFSSQNVNGAW